MFIVAALAIDAYLCFSVFCIIEGVALLILS